MTGEPRRDVPRPSAGAADEIARWLRTNRAAAGVYRWLSGQVVPFLFAVLVAPVGLVILVLYLPKFARNANRRKRYRPQLVSSPVERIPGTRAPRG